MVIVGSRWRGWKPPSSRPSELLALQQFTCKSRKSWIFLDKCESSSGKDQVDAILLKGYFSKFVLKVIKIGSQQMIGIEAEIS